MSMFNRDFMGTFGRGKQLSKSVKDPPAYDIGQLPSESPETASI